MNKLMKVLTIVGGLALLAGPAQAHEKGDWLLRVGGGMVDPNSSNGDVVSVDSGTSLVFNGTYFLSPNLGVEVLAALPFSHDIKLLDGTKVGETKHLPPTVSLQYHFNTDAAFRPYVGGGLNYTLFFDEKLSGPLSDATLKLDPSFGFAAQIGADLDLSDKMFLNFDVRWINIETDASIPEAALDFKVEIDPMVYSLTLGWRF